MMQPAASGGLIAISDVLPQGLIQVDAAGAITYLNPAAARFLNISIEAVSGASLEKVWPDFPQGPPFTRVETINIGNGSRVIQISSIEELHQETRRRQAAETALETNQAFLQAVLDHIETGIVACDATGSLKLFNRATRMFHGVFESPVPPEEWSARYNLYYPDGVTPMRKEDIPLYRAFSGEVVKNVEMVIAPVNGPRRTVLSSGRAVTARHGEILGAVVAMHDITHRKLFGERIRQALRQFRSLFNEAPIAYHEADVQGIVRRVNRAECHMLERSRNEIVGRPAWDFVAPSEQQAVRDAFFESLKGQAPIEGAQREYAAPSGKSILVQLYENAIFDSSGAITGIRTAMLDITDRRRREQQARVLEHEREARALAEAASAEIRSILERIGDAYIAFDTDWRYTYVNRRAAELARKPASELLGRCVWDEFPNAVRTRFYSELMRAMKEQIPVEFENYYAPLGKYFENTVYPSPNGVGVFYRDITERVLTHRELEERTRELALKNAELETFASVASHDLQEPLRMIGSYASLLSRRYSGAVDEEATEFLSYITQGVDRMQRLIRDLLALCRLDATTGAAVNDVSLGSIIDMVKGNLELALEDSRGVIRCGELPVLRFNETRLLQLMQNLIGNALKYKSEAAPVIEVSAERELSAWKITVCDNGTGFEMRHAEQIFEPFRRLHRDGSRGTGIGLAICKKIVETRGGRIWAESVPGTGSTFSFLVPDTAPDDQ